MKILNALSLFIFVLVPACRSDGKHDYYSVNRSSRDFLRGTSRKFAEIRRESWRSTFDDPERALNNRDVRKESRRFTRESFWYKQLESYRAMKRSLREEPERNRELRRGAMRFGFVDSGD